MTAKPMQEVVHGAMLAACPQNAMTHDRNNEGLLIPREQIPEHVTRIPELDFSSHLAFNPLRDPWFQLGIWSVGKHRDERGIEEVIERQSLLIPAGTFTQLYPNLGAIGDSLDCLGQPVASVLHQRNGSMEYQYNAFHKFEIRSTSIIGEPLAFWHSGSDKACFLINPDIVLQLGLEERPPSSRTWWDPRNGNEVLQITNGAVDETVNIRTRYLLEYLRARQMALLVGHYSHLHLFAPTAEQIAAFEVADVEVGAPENLAKALFWNWGLRKDVFRNDPFLQRRLHLWFCIEPPAVDMQNPWHEQPDFDIYAYTLPTRDGPVAPARFRNYMVDHTRVFQGVNTDFMRSIFFRQEVLVRYETSTGFSVADDGSVRCAHYWGLYRSTRRHGNELLSTAIGDFAEGVPFEEWEHWRHYAVDPPSHELASTINTERPIPEAVNDVVDALHRLNGAFQFLESALGVEIGQGLWQGSLDSLAGRQLKWVYPSTAKDDEFLKRATLLSTLAIDELQPAPLRLVLMAVGKGLHRGDDGKTLGSRKLLERTVLASAIVERARPNLTELAELLLQAEAKTRSADAELREELEKLNREIRAEFAPLAFLYDLRTHGGLAHPPNPEEVATASMSLGLPRSQWRRRDFLRLLCLTTNAIDCAATHFVAAARML